MKVKEKICLVLVVFFVAFQVFAQPTNDNFANRIQIIGTNLTISGSLSNATSEIGEPLINEVSSGQTAWWTWGAPSNGIVTLSVSATNFNPLLTVYTGDALSSLSLVASNNYLICYEYGCGCFWRERYQTTFHVARGQVYQIAADSAIIMDASVILQTPSIPTNITNFPVEISLPYWTTTITTNVFPGGNLNLQLQFTPAPKNDDFERRIKFTGSRTHFATSNAGATKQTAEPDHLGNPGGSSVWYSWSAPVSGRVTLSSNNIPPYLPPSWTDVYFTGQIWGEVCGIEIDQNPPPVFYPFFAAYTGTNLSSLIPANCLPIALDAYPYAVEFDAVKGQTYQIAFDGNMGTTANITLYLALTTPAVNNNFQNRIVVHGINVAVTGFNAGATHESGEPIVAGSTGKSVWWSWTAPVGGTVSIDLTGSDYSFPVAVFTGTKVSNLNVVTTAPGSASFESVQGQTYQIAVDDAAGLTGEIKFTLQAPIVEAPLLQQRTYGSSALLTYKALPGQELLLQESKDGVNWKDIRVAAVHLNYVSFLVSPPPIVRKFLYRAIIVDYLAP